MINCCPISFLDAKNGEQREEEGREGWDLKVRVGEGSVESSEGWDAHVCNRERCVARDGLVEPPKIGPEVLPRLNNAFQGRLRNAVATLNPVGNFF